MRHNLASKKVRCKSIKEQDPKDIQKRVWNVKGISKELKQDTSINNVDYEVTVIKGKTDDTNAIFLKADNVDYGFMINKEIVDYLKQC